MSVFHHIQNGIIAIIACILMIPLFWPKTASAAPFPDIEVDEQQKYSIAFIQTSIPIYLYKDVQLNAAIDVTDLRRKMMAHAHHHPYLRMISDEIMAKNIQVSGEYTETIFQAEIDMGYTDNLMAADNYVLATTLNQRVIQNFNQIQMAYLNPKMVAKAYQMLAYNYIAQYYEETPSGLDLHHLARTAFIELIRLAPHITMLEGRQSQDRVTTYDEALELFMGQESYRRTPLHDAAALAHRINVDLMPFLRIVQQRDGSFKLEIDLYQKGEMVYASLPIVMDGNIDQERYSQLIADTATAWLSNQYDCLKIAEPEVPEPEFHQFGITVGPVYAAFLRHPTADLLHSVGGYASFLFMFNENFFIRAGFETVAVLPDKAHDLYDSFTAYRVPLQLGISKEFSYFRIFLATGLEMAFSTEYTITKSIICKTYGTDDTECLPQHVISNRDPFALQIPFSMGVDFGVDPFYVTAEIFVSATVYPIKQNVFRHPLGTRLGVTYRF